MTSARMLCVLVVAVAVAGCETDAGPKQGVGTLGLVSVDRLLESKIGDAKDQLAATAVGTLLGPYQGSEVGKSLDRADRRYAEDAALESLGTSPAGQTSRWSNPDSGHAGAFTPTNTYRSEDGLRCRDYEQSITIDGRTQDVFGAACQADDGSWRIVETPVRRVRRARRRRR